MIIHNALIDGKPCDGKLSRTVWSGGKLGDYIKELPIAISQDGEHRRHGHGRAFKGYSVPVRVAVVQPAQCQVRQGHR